MKVDTDRSGQIDAAELQRALSHTHTFHVQTVAIIMKCFDRDDNGHINFQEFAQLWTFISQWKECFDRLDTDRSGNLDFGEMKQALASFGYRLTDPFISMAMQKCDSQRRCAFSPRACRRLVSCFGYLPRSLLAGVASHSMNSFD